MEFLKKVESKGPLSCDTVLKIFYQTCRAVQHLHRQKPPIIHRDLKVGPRPPKPPRPAPPRPTPPRPGHGRGLALLLRRQLLASKGAASLSGSGVDCCR